MINLLKKLMGSGWSLKASQQIEKGAIILDVRTKREYESGHIPDSENIPLSQLKTSLYMLPDKKSKIIICCTTGVKSATAKKLLEAEGYSQISDGGSWQSLQTRLK